MQIRIRSNGEVLTDEQFRGMYQNVSLPFPLTTEILNSLGADVVFDGPQPTLTHHQTASLQGVVETNGQWYTNWVAVDMSDEAKTAVDAQQAASVRQQRDAKLAASDWTQLSDAPVDKTAWSTYRQALRDLPKETGFPWDITWPTSPAGA
jgi:hypothetical protein